MVPPFSVKIPISSVSIFIFQAGSFKNEARLCLSKSARLANVRPVLRRNDLRCICLSFSNTIYCKKLKILYGNSFFFFVALKSPFIQSMF